MAGVWWSGFQVTTGIRQGCPLSPLLFVLVTEPFNRELGRLSAHCGYRAFADDLALVAGGGPNIWRAAKRLFDEFARASGLHLNLAKSVVLPLWDWRLDAAKAVWQREVPEWASMRVAHSGTYLGFQVGPLAADATWEVPLRRFKEAILSWEGHGLGMHLTVLAYNVFIFPRLLYAAQLHGVCAEWPKIER